MVRSKTDKALSIAGLLLLLFWQSAHAVTIGVIYPRVEGAYQKVFDNVIEGIDAVAEGELRLMQLDDAATPAEVTQWLKAQRADVLIALGQRGYELAARLDAGVPVVVGAALIAPNGISGISMAADPDQFFQRLGSLTPPVKRVFTVYSRKNSQWLIDIANQSAKRYDIELIAYEADDVRNAARGYIDIVGEVRNQMDAIWLPLDNVAPDKVYLPLVLETAWKKRLTVFSNNPSHASKGALFSLYPDNRLTGKRLGEMALDRVASPHKASRVIPLSDLKVAVNLRTASHLGLHYSREQQRDFALVFPRQ